MSALDAAIARAERLHRLTRTRRTERALAGEIDAALLRALDELLAVVRERNRSRAS